MGSYVQSIVEDGESVLYEAKLSLWSMAAKIIVGVLTIPFFGIGLLLLISVFLRYISTELVITNKRIVAKFGFISRRTVELDLARIESIQVDQGIFGRIFNFGTLVLAGAGTPQAPIPGISAPLAFRSAFTQARK